MFKLYRSEPESSSYVNGSAHLTNNNNIIQYVKPPEASPNNFYFPNTNEGNNNKFVNSYGNYSHKGHGNHMQQGYINHPPNINFKHLPSDKGNINQTPYEARGYSNNSCEITSPSHVQYNGNHSISPPFLSPNHSLYNFDIIAGQSNKPPYDNSNNKPSHAISSGLLQQIMQPRRWRYRWANCYRRWKKTIRFLLTCVICVLFVEVVVHRGEQPFGDVNHLDMDYQQQEYAIVPSPRTDINIVYFNRSADNIVWPEPGLPERHIHVIPKIGQEKLQNDAILPVAPIEKVEKLEKSWLFRNESLSWEARVNDLVAQLSVDDIISQTIATYDKATSGVSRFAIRPFVWISECPSGITSSYSTAFPNPLAMAATFSPEAIFKVAEAISKEVRGHWNENVQHRKYHTFYGLNCLSPTLDLMRHPLWGRNQETFGEDPYLSGALGAKFVSGLQGTDPRYIRVAATCKHFAVHGGPEVKVTTFDSKVSERDLYMSYLPSFQQCVAAGAVGLMCGHNKVNGVPACANKHLLTDIVRGDWKFNGFVISDSMAIHNLQQTHKYSPSATDSAAMAIKAGCNLEMTSSNVVYRNQKEALKAGLLTESEIRENVKPLFYTRMRLGDFDKPSLNPYNTINTSVVQSNGHRELAIQVAMMSFVLLKNENNVLPINGKVKRVAVVGPFANRTHAQYGSLAPKPNIKYAKTPLDGITKLAEKVQFADGCSDVECKDYDPEAIKTATTGIDMVFVCLGTGSEIQGKDRSNLNLPGKQLKLLQDSTRGRSRFPVILLLFNGGPLDISWAKSSDRIHAIIEMFFPAQSTGEALYRILTKSGPHSVPAGRLPSTWPADTKDIPEINNYNLSTSGWTYRYLKKEPLYPFGYGLSYTKFEYKYVKVEPSTVQAGKFVKVTVAVVNQGPYSGDEVLQVYLSWDDKQIGAPKWTLVASRRIYVKLKEEMKYEFTIRDTQMAIWVDARKSMQVLPGTMTVTAGGQQPNQKTKADSNLVTAQFTVTPR